MLTWRTAKDLRQTARLSPAGTMSAFEVWAKATSPTVAQASIARTEVWKKAGLLAG